MLNNFIYAKTKALFEEQLNNGNILNEAIVFIEDTKEIWNHGHYFAGESIDPELLEQIQGHILYLDANKPDNFDEILSVLQDICDNKKLHHLYIWDTHQDPNLYLGEAEVVRYYDGEYRIINNVMYSNSYSVYNYIFKTDGTYKRYAHSIKPALKEDVVDKLDKMINVTYSELVALRDNAQLVPGQQYRIVDYITTTTQENTQSAGHQFDIIVTADDEKTLNEVARACHSEFNIEKYKDGYSVDMGTSVINSKMQYVGIFTYGQQDFYLYESEQHDTQMLMSFKGSSKVLESEGEYMFAITATYVRWKRDSWSDWVIELSAGIAFKYDSNEDLSYFNNSNLAAWKIWYSLDNDTERFAWADTENGKGVIYRMIDEWGNDCPYDFKNIQFKRNLTFENDFAEFSEDGDETWVYTFAGQSYHFNNDEWSGMLDGSLESPFGHMSDENTSTFHDNTIKPYIMAFNDNEIRTECGLRYLNDIVFLGYWEKIGSANDGDMPYYYAFCCYSNSFENNCHSNSLGNSCKYNSFGNGCYSNTFGYHCSYNSFGNGCFHNSFDNGCDNNTFGNGCYSNTFGNGCYSNTFGNGCNSNSFGNDCKHNSFGNNCSYNSFGNECESNTFENDCYENTLGISCRRNSFGAGCRYNIFGEKCYANSFGNNCGENSFVGTCYNNSLGDGCFSNSFGTESSHNSFGNICNSNSFGSSCYRNSFGNYCLGNSFGNSCNYNSFGNGCSYNSFRTSALAGTLKSYCYYNHFDDGCSYNVIWYSNTTSSSKLLKNINVNRGVSGRSSKYNFINIDTINSEKEINVINYTGHIYIDYGDIFRVTYSELVDLRENSQLIPGRQYRIIDYNTTTSQENTTSAGHPFDIIVTAIDNERLSEEAQAAQNHINDNGYFNDSNLSAWKIWYSFDNDTDRFEWAGDERIETTTVETIVADSSECTIKSELIDGNTFITPFNFESCVWVDANGDGETYDGGSNHDAAELVYEWGYFTDENDNTQLCLYKSNADLYVEEGQPDYGDKYLYRGVIDVDGTDYDYWQKWDENGDGLDVQGNGDYVFATTPRIVSNPEAYSSETTTETIETVIPLEPKGVIYRMIDEFGNDLPYDFKNIMFVRYKLEAPEGNDILWMQQLCNNVRAMFDEGIRSFVWAGIADEDKYWNEGGQILSHTTGEKLAFFTFNTNENTDASLSGSTHGNKMQLSQTLPNNVFFGNYYGNNSFGNSCNNNSFGYDCSNNSFSNDCFSNSFGNHCSNNSFGNECYYNSFGNECCSNSFGDTCYYNSFGSICDNNNFGVACNYNSVGNECYFNSFCNGCSDNIFGDACYSNSFGDRCGSNSFGNNCYRNSFGTSCEGNSFESECRVNSFGNHFNENSFGAECAFNSFGHACGNNSLGENCKNNSFGENCDNNSFGNNCNNNSFMSKCNNNSLGPNCSNNSFAAESSRNSFEASCQGNSFGASCVNNSLGEECNGNSFGADCSYNRFVVACNGNIFGGSCIENRFEAGCAGNSFGRGCQGNSFGESCGNNIFGNDCSDNSFGVDCFDNSFGNHCYSNTFGNVCYDNTFGNVCSINSFGNECKSNSFGNYCHDNSFRSSASQTASLKNYVQYNHFDDECSYNVIWYSSTVSSDVLLKNINVNRGVHGTSSNYNFINIDTLNADYEIQVAKNSKGEIKIYCEADLIA